jgi:hypothetical protein
MAQFRRGTCVVARSLVRGDLDQLGGLVNLRAGPGGRTAAFTRHPAGTDIIAASGVTDVA